MKVCVVGCGAVGSLFAANLATLDGVEVWAYDLAQAHVDAINRDGLRLTGAGEVLGRPHATTCGCEWPTFRQPTPPAKSMNVFPSRSVSVAPRASAATTGKVIASGAATLAARRSSTSRERGPGTSVWREIVRVTAMGRA